MAEDDAACDIALEHVQDESMWFIHVQMDNNSFFVFIGTGYRIQQFGTAILTQYEHHVSRLQLSNVLLQMGKLSCQKYSMWLECA